jgi:hypothetical protein
VTHAPVRLSPLDSAIIQAELNGEISRAQQKDIAELTARLAKRDVLDAKAKERIASAIADAEWILIVHGVHRQQLSHALIDIGDRHADRLTLDREGVEVLAGFFADVAKGWTPPVECWNCGGDKDSCRCCKRHRLNGELDSDCTACVKTRWIGR